MSGEVVWPNLDAKWTGFNLPWQACCRLARVWPRLHNRARVDLAAGTGKEVLAATLVCNEGSGDRLLKLKEVSPEVALMLGPVSP